MPRSKDPRNYAQFYTDLAISMDSGVPEISLDTSGRNAIYIRNNFYGFLQACKHEAETITRHKGLADEEKIRRVETALHLEEVMRRYMVMIDPMLKEQINQPMRDWPQAKIRWINRDLDPRHADLSAQLSTFMKEHNVVEKVAEQRRLERQMTTGTFNKFKDVGSRLRDKDSPVAHFFAGLDTVVDEDMTDELADKILSAAPPDRTDLTDLITPSNEAVKPTAVPTQKEIFELAEKARERELKGEGKIPPSGLK